MITARETGRMKRTILRTMMILAYLVISLSCRPVEGVGVTTTEGDVQCGKIEGDFGQEWFDYYERGLSFSDCGQDNLENEQRETAIKYLELAVTNFETAIRLKKGEIWQAKIDDTHYVDYFPHRELGIVYFLLGKYENANEELGVSIKYETTSKATCYLDETRDRLSQLTQESLVKQYTTHSMSGTFGRMFSRESQVREFQDIRINPHLTVPKAGTNGSMLNPRSKESLTNLKPVIKLTPADNLTA
ncbi:conserved hypothetical protein, secreted, partial [Candidatus Magnetobacterium bavaricum]